MRPAQPNIDASLRQLHHASGHDPRSEEAKAFYTSISLTHIPAWSPIIQIGQTLWSAVLLFLFLLALRNQSKKVD